MPFDDEKKIERLKKREDKLVSKGYKAVDEGRDRRADRILGRAANVENRIITLEEKGKMAMKNDAIDRIGKYSISKEFDGKEVKGTLSMKKNILGKTVGVEKFNFPNGGTRVEKTVYNNEGKPTRRITKDKKIN
jgi:hypothetical protein